MKTVSQPFLDHMAESVTHLALLTRIIRRDEVEVRLTNHDSQLEFDDLAYQPCGDDVVSIIQATTDMNADNADVKVAYREGAITKRDVLARLYDGARVEAWAVNYTDPDNQYVRLPTARIGKATANDREAVLEIVGIKSLLQRQVGEITTPGCRAELGDSRCRISLNWYTEHGVVIGVEGRYKFAAELVELHTRINHQTSWAAAESDWFTKGRVTWMADLDETFTHPTTGDQQNDGLEMEIQKYEYAAWTGLGTVPIFTLAQSMPFDIQVGDKFRVSAGCKKTIAVCHTKFGNEDNFRGEPYVPGHDKARQYPDPVT